MTQITVTLHADCTFMIASDSFLLKMRNFSTKVVQEIIMPFTIQCGKIRQSQTNHRWQYDTVHALCMLGNLRLQTHTHFLKRNKKRFCTDTFLLSLLFSSRIPTVMPGQTVQIILLQFRTVLSILRDISLRTYYWIWNAKKIVTYLLMLVCHLRNDKLPRTVLFLKLPLLTVK
jgi:hypothetical protein